LVFTRNPVVAGRELAFSIDAGICHAFTGVDATTVVNGNQVDIVMDGLQFDDIAFCNLPEFTYQFAIDGLPPGDVVVRVRIQNVSDPFQLFPPALVTRVAVQSPAVELSAISTGSLIILAAALILGALVSFWGFRQ
jgi:hypothetical protein